MAKEKETGRKLTVTTYQHGEKHFAVVVVGLTQVDADALANYLQGMGIGVAGPTAESTNGLCPWCGQEDISDDG